MRSLPNDIPCNLVLVREPEQDTVPRHMRLPSYEAMTKRRDEEERRHDLLAIQRFNGNNDPHITEADCRKPKVSGDISNGVNVAAITAFVNSGAWESLGESYERALQRVQMKAVAYWAQRALADVAGLNPSFYTKELQQPKADPEGWIQHDTTKPCPVAEGTRVRVRLRNGSEYEGDALLSNHMRRVQWLDDGSGSDVVSIVAYRVLPG